MGRDGGWGGAGGDPVPMGTSLGRGGVARCLWNGCPAVLVLALLTVCGLWVGLGPAHRHGENEARDSMRQQVARTRSRLAGSAGDGVVLGTEIERDVRTAPVAGPVQVRRQGGTVTVTARLAGFGPGVMDRIEATACYRFRVVAARVTSARVPDTACAGPASAFHRPPAQIADDVVAQVRAALGKGGLNAVRAAPVWRTPGIDVLRMESSKGGLNVTAGLLDAGVSFRAQCCAFAVRQAPPSVTARKPAAGRCA